MSFEEKTETKIRTLMVKIEEAGEKIEEEKEKRRKNEEEEEKKKLKMEGEISELRELILALQDGQREEKGRREQVEKEVEELKEMILIMRAEGDKKDKEIMKLKKPNKSIQKKKEVLYKDEFDKEMKHF